ADRLARELRARGIGPDRRVGVLLERSAGLIVALLAVLKAGGAYVGLDSAYPAERLALMVEDSAAALVLAADERPFATGAPRLRIDEPASGLRASGPSGSGAEPGALAYLIFTSGSTGRPKAVGVEHASAVAFCRWAAGSFSADELA